MNLKRIMHGVHSDRPPTIGKDVEILKSGLTRYGRQSGAGEDFFPKPPAGYDPVYNAKTVDAVRTLQELERGSGNTAIKVSGDTGQATWDVVWQYLDPYRRMQYRAFIVPKPKPAVPDLGPIYQGGKSVLLHSPTHDTDGIPGVWPAFDDGWVAGRTLIAPEDMKVTEQSGSAGGDAVFCRGASSLEYWIGHMAIAPATNRIFDKGEKVGVIANIPWSQGGPHVHLAINAKPLIGRDLLYGRNGNGPDYTYGSATVGVQLKEALSL